MPVFVKIVSIHAPTKGATGWMVRETLEGENGQLRLKAAMYVLKVSGLEEFMKPEEGGGEQTVREALLEAIQEVEEEMGIREG